MRHIHFMNLRTLDLNLLVVFDALMRERHVTRAAAAIGLSQPAFSNALTRLRARLGDELFIRTPDGMKPTAWAIELSGPISAALHDIQTALNGAHFDPRTSAHRIAVATPDYAAMTLFPKLIVALQDQAPGIVLQTITPSQHWGEYLDTQRADMALLNWPNPPERFSSQMLFQEDWVCVMRQDHPLATGTLSLDQFSAVNHLLVSPQGDRRNWVDDALARHARTRHIAYTMPAYGMAPMILGTTDFVLTCPASVAKVCHEYGGLSVVDCPLKPPDKMQSIHMVWHTKLGNHPVHRWFRALLQDVSVVELIKDH